MRTFSFSDNIISLCWSNLQRYWMLMWGYSIFSVSPCTSSPSSSVSVLFRIMVVMTESKCLEYCFSHPGLYVCVCVCVCVCVHVCVCACLCVCMCGFIILYLWGWCTVCSSMWPLNDLEAIEKDVYLCKVNGMEQTKFFQKVFRCTFQALWSCFVPFCTDIILDHIVGCRVRFQKLNVCPHKWWK